MRSTTLRLVLGGLAVTGACAVVGFALEFSRFGRTPDVAATRLESDVRDTFARRTAQLDALTADVAARATEVDQATRSPQALTQLFLDLVALTSDTAPTASVTIYVPAGPPGEFKVLAWSDGPAEVLSKDQLGPGPALFAITGTLGLTLDQVRPIDVDGHRIAVVAATSVLAGPPTVSASPGGYFLQTAYGPVELTPSPVVAPIDKRRGGTLLLAAPGGAPVVAARFQFADLDATRRGFQIRVLTIAAVPLVTLLLLLAAVAADRRAASGAVTFWKWSGASAALVAAAASALVGVSTLAGLPGAAILIEIGFALFALVIIGPLGWWQRRHARRLRAAQPARFLIEQTLGGLAAAATTLALARFFGETITSTRINDWQFPLFSSRPDAALFLAGLVLVEGAAFWTITAGLGALAFRWRVTWRGLPAAFGTLVCWLAPLAAAVPVLARRGHAVPIVPLGAALVVAGAVALTGGLIRRLFQRATQAARLALLFAGVLLPALVWYPAADHYALHAARTLIEDDYAPAVMHHPDTLIDALALSEREIDRFPALGALVDNPHPLDTATAFNVWKNTELAHARLTSAIELYGPNRTLVSRFALNVPEYLAVKASQKWTGTSCDWTISFEAGHFGSEDRRGLQAERGLCDATQTPRGAVVVHLFSDYRALPFISSESPYYDVLKSDATPQSARIADLQVAVYGWGLTPAFTSNHVAWTITPALFTRLYASREPFWTTLLAGDRRFQVRVLNDQSGIYAVGYPTPTAVDHLIRLSEAASVSGAIFIVMLLAATAQAALIRRRPAALRLLLDEVRTSFYRKLFLYFVLAAVGPVLAFAVVFRGYMAAKYRADIESEAATTVTVARRVLQESLASQEHPGVGMPAPTDDVMVLIGQILQQDVNLFEGPSLSATSQRDLFESGLLPTRTPAAVYRRIALERLPTYVQEDQIGDFRYLIAAAPVPERGNEAVLSAPLALKQRDLDREIADLDRGMLAGAVFVVLFAAGAGVYIAGRISDPVSRLSRAAKQIAAGRLDVRIVADTADELRRLVDDFNRMAATLRSQQAELVRTNQLKAWAEMARQVAHEIKNPLTPIQLAAEHLRRVHSDRGAPLTPVLEQCIETILGQVRLLRQIAGEFSNFAASPTPHFEDVAPSRLLREVVQPYLTGLAGATRIQLDVADDVPPVRVDRTLAARALTNVMENALQAMPHGGTIAIAAHVDGAEVVITIADSGVGMDRTALARVFEPYFSTKTGGSGLGLPNAKRNIELCGGSMTLTSASGEGTTVTIRLPQAVAHDPIGHG